MRKILKFLLGVVTTLVIKRHRPVIVGVTGSVGKTSTKEAVYEAFKDRKRIRKSAGNLNTETGAPLVFLKKDSPGRGLKEWLKIMISGLWLAIKGDKNYPEIVVVELAADKPGDIKYLTRFIKPDIAIITAVGEVPVHVEFYDGPQEVRVEKEEMLRNAKRNSTAILNIDDPYVSEMSFDGRRITFGFSEEADISISNIEEVSSEGSRIHMIYGGEDFSIFLPLCIGESFAYISGAVFATGVALSMLPEEIVKDLQRIRPTKGRLYPVKGKKESVILDGSYNAAPASMESSLGTLQGLPGKRKVAMLGDMLELGEYSYREHQRIGEMAGKICDILVLVGDWAREMKKGAMNAGMDEENIFVFSNSQEASSEVEELLSPEDLILVKGSQGIRMERVILSLMRDPERAQELLVRQKGEWNS